MYTQTLLTLFCYTEKYSSLYVIKDYSRRSAERLLAVDDRPEETVSNSLILIDNIMYYA